MENNKEHISINELQEIMKNEPGDLILKSHMTSDFTPFSNEKRKFLRKLINGNTKIIYIYRDGRDVMVSLYFYMMSFADNLPNFSDFIRMKNDFDGYYPDLNRVGYWRRHVWGWINYKDSKVLKLSYEKLHLNFLECMDDLESFLDIKRNKKCKKIKFYKKKNIFNRIKHKFLPEKWKSSAILPRKGIIGDWHNYFSESDLQFFKNNTGDLMNKLGYH